MELAYSPRHTVAKRGDIAVVEYVAYTTAATTYATTRSTEFVICAVTNITKDGSVKAVRELAWNGPARAIANWNGFTRVYVLPGKSVDMPGVISTVKAHVYPGHNTVMPYSSMNEVREALAPHRLKD